LIYSAIAHVGFNGQALKMSDASILRTFWAAAVIQFAGLLISIYFARAYGKKYTAGKLAH
jgi:hypothetical protein